MSKVLLRIQSNGVPGFAVGEFWPAFANAAFERYNFTAYYGPTERPLEVSLPNGNYWVQLKLPSGEIIQNLVAIPEQPLPVEVVIQLPVSLESKNSMTSAFSLLTPRQSPDGSDIAPNAPHFGLVAPRTRVPRLRSTTFADPVPATRFTVDHLVGLRDEDGSELLLKSRVETSYSLRRVRANFIDWNQLGPLRSRPHFDRPRRPNSYFAWAIRHAKSITPVQGALEGGSFYAELPRIGDDVFEQTQADIKFGRFKRDLLIVKGGAPRSVIVASIPNGWGYRSAAFRLTQNRSLAGNPLKISIEVKDVKFNAILQFIRRGDLNAAMHLIQSSVEMLYSKFDNPFAAAAAGYVLIQAAPNTLHIPWADWIGNLAHYFKGLPDGGILHATLLLQRGDVIDGGAWPSPEHERYFPVDEEARYELAAKMVVGALAKGPPLFRVGLSLLASNLLILRSVQLSDEMKLRLFETEQLVTWLSMRVDPVEPFCTFYLKDRDAKSSL